MGRPSFSRRDILQMTLAAGGLGVTTRLFDSLGFLLAQDPERVVTPEQAMGPFYPVMKPLDKDADLTVIRGKRGRAQGSTIHVMGRVVDHKGEPVRGAQLEIWQANAAGRYAHPSDGNPAPLDPNFQGYCIIKTDRDGRYRFKSVKPGAYPIGPGTTRPPHIHFEVLGHKNRLVTQMYFPGEPLNEKDDIFNQMGQFKNAAIAKLLPPTKELEPDSKLVMWDIVLDRG
jgi:protocatechuate 3,4-dioxygenase beta subunit